MNDGCCYLDVDEQVETIFQKIRKARKPHTCTECAEPIQPGGQYEYLFGKYDGENIISKVCMSCLRVRDGVFCGDYPIGDMWEHIGECLGWEVVP